MKNLLTKSRSQKRVGENPQYICQTERPIYNNIKNNNTCDKQSIESFDPNTQPIKCNLQAKALGSSLSRERYQKREDPFESDQFEVKDKESNATSNIRHEIEKLINQSKALDQHYD